MGNDVVRMVFDGNGSDYSEYGADVNLADQKELKNLRNSGGKQPRGKNFRALLTCHNGTLEYDDDGVTYKIKVNNEPKQLEVQEDRIVEQQQKTLATDSLPLPPQKVAKVSSGLEEERIEMVLNRLRFSQKSKDMRKDYASSLPEKFQIGAKPSFQEPILQQELFNSFSYHIEINAHDGDRRVLPPL